MTRHWPLLLAITLGLAALSALYRASRPAIPPGLIPVERVHDCGVLEQGQRVAHTFTLTNTASVPITVTEISATCGCTKLDCTRRKLAPGEQTEVNAEWSVGAARGAASVQITLVYELEGVGQRYNILELKAHVTPDIRAEPEWLVFSRAQTEQRVRFLPGRLSEFRIEKVYCDHPAFEAQQLPASNEVLVRFHPEKWEEYPLTNLIVMTSSPREPKIAIRLVVREPDEPMD